MPVTPVQMMPLDGQNGATLPSFPRPGAATRPVHTATSSASPTSADCDGSTGQIQTSQSKFFRAHCLWELDKNTYVRYEHRWITTMQREWQPDVALVCTGKLIWTPENSDRFNAAAKSASIFLLEHISDRGPIGQHLFQKMAEAR